MINRISVPQAQLMIKEKDAIVVDIRDSASYAHGHIDGAILLDNDNFQAFIDNADKSRPIIVCCYHGNSSQASSGVISSLGFQSYSLDGGMADWEQNASKT